MIPASSYQYVYVLFILLLTSLVGARYSLYGNDRILRDRKQKVGPALLLTFIMWLFIGFRPISIYFTDMVGYAEAMTLHTYEGIPVNISSNYLFTPLMAFLSSHNASPQTPIVILAAINLIGTFIAVRKLFPNDTLIMLLVVWGSFVSFATMTNGIKAGCAMSLLLCAIAYREKLFVGFFFLFLSMGFHHSMIMPIVAFIACLICRNCKIYFAIWIICLLCAILHVTFFQFLFGSMADESASSYLLSTLEDSNFGGRTGFRIDFVAYSSVPVLVGYYAIYKKRIESISYSFILNMYLLTNSVWMLCMYAPYTNRIAEIPWGILPFAMSYPFLKENWGGRQYRTFKRLAYGNVAFTFFMTFVYYMFIYLDR